MFCINLIEYRVYKTKLKAWKGEAILWKSWFSKKSKVLIMIMRTIRMRAVGGEVIVALGFAHATMKAIVSRIGKGI